MLNCCEHKMLNVTSNEGNKGIRNSTIDFITTSDNAPFVRGIFTPFINSREYISFIWEGKIYWEKKPIIKIVSSLEDMNILTPVSVNLLINNTVYYTKQFNSDYLKRIDVLNEVIEFPSSKSLVSLIVNASENVKFDLYSLNISF